MKRYIVLTYEGYTYEPDGKDIENLQVLGVAEGTNEEEAIDNLLKENPWIKNTSFKSTICIEIIGDLRNAREIAIVRKQNKTKMKGGAS